MSTENKPNSGVEFSSVDGQVEVRRLQPDGSVAFAKTGVSTSSPDAFLRLRRQLEQGGFTRPRNTDDF